jgi:type IV pilus assembly protein PilQ
MQAFTKGIVGTLALCAAMAMPVVAQGGGQAVPPQGQAQSPQGQAPAQQGQAPAQGQVDVSSPTQGDRSSRISLRLKDRDLREVVASIAKRANVNIVMDQAIEATVTMELDDVEWRQALELVAEQAGCVVEELAGGVLRVEKPPRVFFSFENTDIVKVIDTISKISGANIVVAPEVKGMITVRLKNVPWRDALETTVKTLGFVVVEDVRGVLRVVPPSNIEQDLVTETFQLRYVRPQSTYVPFLVSEYVEDKRPTTKLNKGELQFTLLDTLRKMVTPEIGNLEYIHERNIIVVKDTRPVVDNVRRTIEMCDTEPSQIYLDVRFATTTNEDVLDVGVSPGGSGMTASIGLGQIPHRLPFDLGQGGWDDKLFASDNGFGPSAFDNTPANTVVPDVVFGALDFTQVTATLRLLKKDANSEIVQAPQIVALDHQTATIFVGEAVRYAQARVEQGQAGGLLQALEEGDDSPVNVGFQLLATPHIVPGTDKVILEVIPQRTALTGTGSTQLAPAGFDVFTVGSGAQAGTIALPRVASSTIATTVLLRGGQTAVLGGLKSTNDSETITKLPLLGDIPVLGWMFKNKVRQQTKSTMLVFITPSVIRSPEDMESQFNSVLKERLEDFRSNLSQQRAAIFGNGQ